MIICKAPFRISLFGGGSDHPNFIAKYGYGLVVSAAINKYCYISVKELMPFFPYKSRITYNEIECVNNNEDIKHRVFKNCIEFLSLQDKSLEINYVADLPSGTGLGTSSSMIVCLLEALECYSTGKHYFDYKKLWKDASYIERVMMGDTVGLQDYLPAICGCSNAYKITNNSVDILPLNNQLSRTINRYGLLFYLGKTRNSSETLNNYIDKIPDSQSQLRILQLAEKALKEENVEMLGYYLYESWLAKKSLSPTISNDHIDDVINTCIDTGSYGAKLCGSGGGGCVFVLADPSRHYNIIEAVSKLNCPQIPFQVAPRGVERIL